MLTKSEKEWLKKREQWAKPHNGYGDEGYFCEHCKINCFDGCPTEIRDGNIDAFVDAAEFSEKVAAKLALGCESQTPCNGCWKAHWKYCNLRKGYWDCADCFLKVARLAVEEEMNNDT